MPFLYRHVSVQPYTISRTLLIYLLYTHRYIVIITRVRILVRGPVRGVRARSARISIISLFHLSVISLKVQEYHSYRSFIPQENHSKINTRMHTRLYDENSNPNARTQVQAFIRWRYVSNGVCVCVCVCITHIYL